MWKTIKKLRKMLPRNMKFMMAGLFLQMFVGSLLELIGLSLIYPVVAALSKPEMIQSKWYLKFIYEVLQSKSMNEFLVGCAWLLMFFYIVKALYLIIMFYCQTAFTAKLINFISGKIYAGHINAPYEYFLHQDSGELYNKINQLTVLAQSFIMSFMILCTEVMTVILMTVILFCFSPCVSLGALLFFGIILSALYFLMHTWSEYYGEKSVRCAAKLMSLLRDSISNIKLVKITNSQNFFKKNFLDIQTEVSSANTKTSTLANSLRFIIEAITVTFAMLTLIVVVKMEVPLAVIILNASIFAAAMLRLLPSTTRIQYNLMMVRNHAYLFDVVYQDLTHMPKEELGDNLAPLKFNHNIEIRDLSFSYSGTSKEVLHQISLTIQKNESVAFIGHTGCGKTTLIDLLMGFLTPQSGSINVDGTNILTNLAAWRAKIGYVPQNIYLANSTIKNNIAFGIPEAEIDEKKVEQVLELAQLKTFVDGLPEQSSSECGEGGLRLSGGQKQRIAIARALYFEPEILILDEATSALDDETEHDFIQSVANLKGKLTIIMIAHRKSSLTGCDRIISL